MKILIKDLKFQINIIYLFQTFDKTEKKSVDFTVRIWFHC